MQIEIISGSPRSQSLTHRLAVFLSKKLEAYDGLDVGIIKLSKHVFPFIDTVYTSPADAPEELQSVAERMFAADAYIIVTPEYNGSYSPAMQNLFDHFPKRHHKPFALATASPGALGGMRAAMQLQQFVLALFGIPSPYMLVTPMVDKKFDAEGNLLDASFEKNADQFIREFLWLADRLNSKAQNYQASEARFSIA